MLNGTFSQLSVVADPELRPISPAAMKCGEIEYAYDRIQKRIASGTGTRHYNG